MEALLFLKRLCVVWDAVPPSQRKAFTYKDLVPLHSATAMFLHYTDAVKQRAPADDWSAARLRFEEQFLLGGMDAELIKSAEALAPPGEPESIGMFRTWSFGAEISRFKGCDVLCS